MKKIKLYAISTAPVTATDEEFRKNIVTFVKTKPDILEYVNKKLIVDHYDHYKSWCRFHNLNEESLEAQIAYLDKVGHTWEDTSKYSFKRYVYSIDEIASIFRIVNKCPPVGASYETDTEIEYMRNYLMYYQQFMDILNKKEKEGVDKE